MNAEVEAEVRNRQRARLERKAALGLPRGRPSRWAHVPLGELFVEAGNILHTTGRDDELETGHQPFHASKSGRCVRIDTTLGLWYCRSCKAGGDSPAFWAALHGLGRRSAADQLAARYGAPNSTRRRLAVVWLEV